MCDPDRLSTMITFESIHIYEIRMMSLQEDRLISNLII